MILQEYEGYRFPPESIIKYKSHYNHMYYKGINGEEIYAISDDDNYTEYFIAGIPFAESFSSEGNILHIYDEFKFDSKAWSEGALYDWYISSIWSDSTPIWTEEHISELYNDFYVITKPKEDEKKEDG